MEQWTSTLDKRVAAALAALGVIVRVNTTLREKTGVVTTRFHLSLMSSDKKVHTKRLLGLFASGKLEEVDPGHPFLVILRAHENRRRILDCAHRGTKMRLAPIPGTGSWLYMDGSEGLPGAGKIKDVIRTGDVKTAAALATAGCPLIGIDGARGRFNFYLPRDWEDAQGKPRNGLEMRQQWCEDKRKMCWQDPFVQAMQGLEVREQLEHAVDTDKTKVLVEKPRSVRSALVQIDASPDAWDIVKDHFDR